MSFELLDRALLGYMKEVKIAPTFFLDYFVKNRRLLNSRTNVLDFTFDHDGIATYKENESTAPSKAKDRDKDSVIVKLKTLREEQIITVGDLNERIPGFLIDEDRNRILATLAAEKMEILDNLVMRTHEVAVAQQLLSGALSDPALNLKRKPQNAQSVAISGKGSEAILLLREAFSKLRIYPNIAIFSPTAYDKFFKELDVRFVLGQSNNTTTVLQKPFSAEKYRDVTFEGNFVGVDFYTYRGTYTDPRTGSQVKLVPDDKVFVGNTNAANYFYYLPVSVASQTGGIENVAADKYFKRYVDHKSNSLIIEAYSNALPVLNDINSTGVITVS